MLVLALVTAAWARPKPAILSILNGIDEILADYVGCRLRVAVFTEHNLP